MRRLLISIAAIVAVRALAPATAVARTVNCHKPPPAAAGAPQRLSVSLVAFRANNYKVRWTGKLLRYSRLGVRRTKVTCFQPTSDQWRAFWVVLDAIDVWVWKPDYPGPQGVTDLLTWSVRVTHDQHDLTSEGYGDTPPNFRGFKQGVSTLVDGRPVK